MCPVGLRRALSEAEGQPFAGLPFGFAQGTISIYRSHTDSA